MKTQKISLSFSPLSDADFMEEAKHIESKMNGNTNFPDPTPAMEVVSTAVSNFATALTAAKELGKDNVAGKNKARLDLTVILQDLGRYVMFVAKGDVTKLISSGYRLNKMPQPVHLEVPGNVSISNGPVPGSMVVKVKAVKGAQAYIHQITDAPPTDNTVWVSVTTGRSRYVHTSLTRGKQYWLRAGATGSNEQLTYGPDSSQFAQ
jgi:hypothetical protein